MKQIKDLSKKAQEILISGGFYWDQSIDGYIYGFNFGGEADPGVEYPNEETDGTHLITINRVNPLGFILDANRGSREELYGSYGLYDLNSIFDELMVAGVNVHLPAAGFYSPLFIAAIRNNCHAIQRLVEAGVSPNVQNRAIEGDDPEIIVNDITPVFGAAMRAKNDALKLLIELGADFNHITNVSKMGVLHYAVRRVGNVETIKILINAGINLFLLGCIGLTALEEAQQEINNVGPWEPREQIALVPALSAAMELFEIAKTNDIKQAAELLSLGASVHQRNAEGQTPLMIACQHNQVEMTKFLLENGSDITAWCLGMIQDNITRVFNLNPLTALDLAVAHSNPSLNNLLLNEIQLHINRLVFQIKRISKNIPLLADPIQTHLLPCIEGPIFAYYNGKKLIDDAIQKALCSQKIQEAVNKRRALIFSGKPSNSNNIQDPLLLAPSGFVKR